MKKLWVVLLAMLFMVVGMGTGLANPIKTETVEFINNVKLEVDMNNIEFHKLDGYPAILFTAINQDFNTKKINVSRMYALPTKSEFRILEFEIADMKTGTTLSNSKSPSDWTTYNDSSPTSKCINYIINNYERFVLENSQPKKN